MKLTCLACHKELPVEGELYFSCPEKKEGDDFHHLLKKEFLDLPDYNLSNFRAVQAGSSNPYLWFAPFFYSNRLAQKLRVPFFEIVDEINAGIKKVWGKGFEATPLKSFNFRDLGEIFVKNETGNVSGSHKARHMMGTLIYLEILRRGGVLTEKPPLAIYSCGNAALGAAVIARAMDYTLDVFVPPTINSNVLGKLEQFGARVQICPRREGELGDPCYNRFQEFLAKGSIPFSCSGTDNWSNIEGGQSLGLETFFAGLEEGIFFDNVFIQVGGGALASSFIQTAFELLDMQVIPSLPRFFLVQTQGCFPLARAYFRFLNAVKTKIRKEKAWQWEKEEELSDFYKTHHQELEEIIHFVRDNWQKEGIDKLLTSFLQKSSQLMNAWESEPHSIAHGILDDITYDYPTLLEGLCKSGGMPLIVSEKELEQANELAKQVTKIPVDPTGSSGLAGILDMRPHGSTLTIFTGIER